MDARQGSSPSTPWPVTPLGSAGASSAKWWMLSGLMVALGATSIGIGLIVLASSVVATTYSPDYLAAFYALNGVGIAFIGVSWLFARMTPRLR